MIRHDYAPARLARVRATLGDLLDNVQLRMAAATLGAVVAVIAAAVAIDLHRLAAVDATVAVMSDRVAHASASRARLTTMRADLQRLRSLLDALEAARTAARDDINALVLLGNRLPLDAALTRIHGDRDGSWTIDGRAPRMFAVGTALVEASRVRPGAHVRLLSTTVANSRSHAVRFTLSWERPTP